MEQKKIYKLEGMIKSVKGKCNAGHKKGDKFELSGYSSGGLCGFFYHDIFPSILTLQFGGSFPWQADSYSLTVECPDKHNVVSMEIKKINK